MSIVIDIHTHPAFFETINASSSQLEFRRQAMGLYKASAVSLQHIFNQMDYARIDKIVLLPLDLATIDGQIVVSNDEITRITAQAPERFIGFASVDPHRKEAVEILEHAFVDIGLSGLKLHPSRQKFYPADDELRPIYECCIRHNKPILFHAGMSLEPDTYSKFSRPEVFEEVAIRYPKLRFCLAHFGWPWTTETAALLLKYPNIYTDTGLLYFDSAREFYDHVFKNELGEHWIDRSLRHQVMFGSNNPRFEQIRMIEALRNIGWRETTLDLILGENALTFLG
ncbi:MAG: amidohydrolase family protein [Anaerolineaceae bacterium]|nr:amidohydrolase family protein [Anaerolineaceae bacterium]